MRKVFLFPLLLLLLMQQAFAQEDENLRLSNIKHNPLSITFTDQNGLYGFFDKQSGYYQPPIYDSIDDRCTDPLSPMLVKKDGLWGYVNRSNGEVVVPFQFSGGYGYPLYQNGYALIANRNPSDDGSITYQTYLFDTQGKEVHLPEGLSLQSNVCGSKRTVVVRGIGEDGYYHCGLCSIDGRITVSPRYEDIWFGNCNFFCFRDDTGKIGVMNSEGEIVIPALYYANDMPISYIETPGYDGSLPRNGYYILYHVDGSPVYVCVDNESDSITIFDTLSPGTDK